MRNKTGIFSFGHMITNKLTSILILTLCFCFVNASCEDNKAAQISFCNSDEPVKEISWVKALLEDFESSERKEQVILYKYNDNEVLLVNRCYQCPDAMTEVYDCEHNVICQFGGFAGTNTCPDFDQNAVVIDTLYNR